MNIVNPNDMMACMWYAEWYKKDISPHLTLEQKENLLKLLSEISLRGALWLVEDVPLNQFPELKPFAHTQTFSGLQLYVVLSELFNEVSKTKIPTPYPHLPRKKHDNKRKER